MPKVTLVALAPVFERNDFYRQPVRLSNYHGFERIPAMVIVDAKGMVRFVHYGHSMRDIPQTQRR